MKGRPHLAHPKLTKFSAKGGHELLKKNSLKKSENYIEWEKALTVGLNGKWRVRLTFCWVFFFLKEFSEYCAVFVKCRPCEIESRLMTQGWAWTIFVHRKCSFWAQFSRIDLSLIWMAFDWNVQIDLTCGSFWSDEMLGKWLPDWCVTGLCVNCLGVVWLNVGAILGKMCGHLTSIY